MIWLSLAIFLSVLTVTLMAGYLINKMIDKKCDINTDAATAALSAATEQMHKTFDSRINKSFESIQGIKTELEALRMQIGFKAMNK